jgi:hypothetical protein
VDLVIDTISQLITSLHPSVLQQLFYNKIKHCLEPSGRLGVKFPRPFYQIEVDVSIPHYLLFTRDPMLASYVPKKNQAVILLSTQHHSEHISEEDSKFKPEVILEYNRTKGAVDTLDKMVKEYSCNRTTKRWPLVLFMNMVDIAAINAFILSEIKNPSYNKVLKVKM